MIIFLILLGIIFSVIPFALSNLFQYLKWKVRAIQYTPTRVIWFILFTITLVTFVLNCMNYYWASAKLDTIIYLVFFLFNFIIYLIHAKGNWFYKLLNVSNFILSLPLFIIGIYALDTANKKIYYNSNKYRVEENERTFSLKSPRYIMPKVFEKNGLLERRMQVLNSFDRHNPPDSTSNFSINEKEKKLVFTYYDSGKVKQASSELFLEK